MKKMFFLVINLNLITAYCKAQIYIEPVVGYPLDLNNHNKFKQINTAVQCSFRKNRHYELILLLQKTLPLKYLSSDSSFSLNPALPIYANAQKTIRASNLSLAVGHRLTIVGGKTDNIFFAILYAGLNIQRFAVHYKYDKNNYTILNPDKTLNIGGLYISGGFEYMRKLKNGRFFTQLVIASPPSRKLKYPASFGFMAPVSLNAGYSILIKKSRHEK
jgi:hypothetical protein